MSNIYHPHWKSLRTDSKFVKPHVSPVLLLLLFITLVPEDLKIKASKSQMLIPKVSLWNTHLRLPMFNFATGGPFVEIVVIISIQPPSCQNSAKFHSSSFSTLSSPCRIKDSQFSTKKNALQRVQIIPFTTFLGSTKDWMWVFLAEQKHSNRGTDTFFVGEILCRFHLSTSVKLFHPGMATWWTWRSFFRDFRICPWIFFITLITGCTAENQRKEDGKMESFSTHFREPFGIRIIFSLHRWFSEVVHVTHKNQTVQNPPEKVERPSDPGYTTTRNCSSQGMRAVSKKQTIFRATVWQERTPILRMFFFLEHFIPRTSNQLNILTYFPRWLGLNVKCAASSRAQLYTQLLMMLSIYTGTVLTACLMLCKVSYPCASR